MWSFLIQTKVRIVSLSLIFLKNFLTVQPINFSVRVHNQKGQSNIGEDFILFVSYSEIFTEFSIIEAFHVYHIFKKYSFIQHFLNFSNKQLGFSLQHSLVVNNCNLTICFVNCINLSSRVNIEIRSVFRKFDSTLLPYEIT